MQSGRTNACPPDGALPPCAGIGHFQDITLRLIAERLLPDAAEKTWLQGELIRKEMPPLPPPTATKSYHIYCSVNSEKCAAELVRQLAAAPGDRTGGSRPGPVPYTYTHGKRRKMTENSFNPPLVYASVIFAVHGLKCSGHLAPMHDGALCIQG